MSQPIFPIARHRRLRNNEAMRNLVRETQLHVHDLIYPLFVTTGHDVKEEIQSMPGVYHFSLDRLEAELEEIVQLGIQGVLLFGVPEEKDEQATSAFHPEGIVQQATRMIKAAHP